MKLWVYAVGNLEHRLNRRTGSLTSGHQEHGDVRSYVCMNQWAVTDPGNLTSLGDIYCAVRLAAFLPLAGIDGNSMGEVMGLKGPVRDEPRQGPRVARP